MVKKSADTSRTMEPAQIDDLKLINGIGPAVERRLHGVGVYTFAQLAALSPADIAASVVGLSGLTAERIARQDWIGQARTWAKGAQVIDPTPLDDVIISEGQRLVTFTLELSMDEDNTVLRSHISHLQSGNEDSWDGWQHEQLLRFLAQRAEFRLAASETTAPDASENESAFPEDAPLNAGQDEISSPAATEPRFIGELRLEKLAVVTGNPQVPQNFLPQSQPYSVRLTLDLSDIDVPCDTQLGYSVSVYSKSLSGRPRQKVGEATGIAVSTDSLTVDVKGRTLARGIHRLEAAATLQSSISDFAPDQNATATLDGDLLVIF